MTGTGVGARGTRYDAAAMLTSAQVIPFLTHADPLVRSQAVTYFTDCADPAPLTADDYWAAIDRFAGTAEPGRFGLRATRMYYSHLKGVPQTERSLRRLVEALAGDLESDDADSLADTAVAVDFPLLLAHRDLLLTCPDLPPYVLEQLNRRLSLADASADAVWDRLMALGRKGAESPEVDDDDDEEAEAAEADALIEAAARHIDALADRAMATLVDPAAARDWREGFAVRVLGAARHGPAVPALVDKLRVDDEMLVEDVVDALAGIGTAEVVAGLVAFAPTQPWEVRLYTDEPLARIKWPESESGLVRLLAVEKDDEIRGNLLFGLCDLASLAGLDAARVHVVADPTHPETLDLCEALIATAAMNGVTLPEEPRWRQRLADREAAAAARRDALGPGDLQAFAARMRNRSPEFADDDGADGYDDADDPIYEVPPPPPLPLGGYDPYARLQPLRNDAPKVGRNDPCPCGSGKKHKKCCGAARS